MKILVAAAGSHGDVLPFLALCREFRSRGHEACLYTGAYFEPYARAAGVPLRAIGSGDDHARVLRHPDVTHPIRGHRVIAATIERYLPQLYQALAADVEPGRTLVIGSLLAFPARLLQETHRLPCVTIHLAPAPLRSRRDTSRMSPHDPLPRAPRWVKGLAWRALDALLVDPLYARPVNRYRASLGLPPVRRIFDAWLHGADLGVCMFPDWFAAAQPDWPANLCQTGFPLYDLGESSLPEPVLEFLAAGDPPVGFTAGTATATDQEFFAQSVEACRRSGRRGILLTHRSEQVPLVLPPGVAHFDYVPFSTLLPRLSALVHHGGIGSTSQALRAGVPQLIRPSAYDQFDNSRRAVGLGIALELLPRHYRAGTAAATLGVLLGDGALAERCRHRAQALAQGDAVGRTCELILARCAASGPVVTRARLREAG